MLKLHPLLEPFQATEEQPFSSVHAAHLLHRAGFGGTLAEIAEVQKLGPIAAVERLLDFPDVGADDEGSDTPDLGAINDYPRTFAERRKLYEGKSPQERMELNQMLQRADREAIRATVEWWLGRMTSGPSTISSHLMALTGMPGPAQGEA